MAASGWSWPVTAGSSLLVAAGSDTPSEEKGLGGLPAVFNPPLPALPTPGIKHVFQNSQTLKPNKKTFLQSFPSALSWAELLTPHRGHLTMVKGRLEH